MMLSKIGALKCLDVKAPIVNDSSYRWMHFLFWLLLLQCPIHFASSVKFTSSDINVREETAEIIAISGLLKPNVAPFKDRSDIWVRIVSNKNSFPCLFYKLYPCPSLRFQLWDLTHQSFHPVTESVFSPVIKLLQFPWLLVFLFVVTKTREQVLQTALRAPEEGKAQDSLSLAKNSWRNVAVVAALWAVDVNITWKEHERPMRAVCGGQIVCFTPTVICRVDVQPLWPLIKPAANIWLLLAG